MIYPIWEGEQTFILACGPSLKGFSGSPLMRHGRVIVINDSYQLCPNADVLYFADMTWWNSRKRAVAEGFTGRHIITLDNQIDGVLTMRNSGVSGLETDPAALRNGCNSGYAAINLAYHFGSKRIILLGYDMRVKGDMMHWNHRPERQTASAFQRTIQERFLPQFETIKRPLIDQGVEVWNCTPDSALKVFPRAPLSRFTNAHTAD